jgi:hypothetical protein
MHIFCPYSGFHSFPQPARFRASACSFKSPSTSPVIWSKNCASPNESPELPPAPAESGDSLPTSGSSSIKFLNRVVSCSPSCRTHTCRAALSMSNRHNNNNNNNHNNNMAGYSQALYSSALSVPSEWQNLIRGPLQILQPSGCNIIKQLTRLTSYCS